MLTDASSGDFHLFRERTGYRVASSQRGDLETAQLVQQALRELQSALEHLTSPSSSLYRRLLCPAQDAVPGEEIRLDVTMIRDELLLYFQTPRPAQRGDCLPDLLADLQVPELVVPVGVISAGVREVERTAAIAALAALATDLTISRAVGQATGNPALDLAVDALMVGRCLLRQVGIDAPAETARLDAEVQRRLQGAMINLRIRLYAALAPQVAAGVCASGAGRVWTDSPATPEVRRPSDG